MSATHLAIDATIIVAYFILITIVGLYAGRREHTLEDYALGGRRVPWWAVMASIIAAETSAATFLGAPAEGFTTRGLTYVQLTLGLILGRVLVGHIFLKPYYTYRVYTVYEFLAIRFGTLSKNYISALFLLMRVLASGVRLYVPSLVMVLAWRMFVQRESVQYHALDTWQPYALSIIALTAATCIYTMIGGIKAVIWTDVIQATLMFGSALVAIVTILYDIGHGSFSAGIDALTSSVPSMTQSRGYFLTGFENATPEMNVWDLLRLVLESKYTLPAALLATTALNMAAFGTDQDMVQRMLTASDHKKSRRSLITAALMDVPIAAAFTFIGVLLIAYYAQHPQMMPAKPNDVFGVYILSAMPVGIRGLVLAGVFATAMGSLSAALNALATTATNDWYIPYFAPKRDGAHHVAAARVFTGVFAIFLIVIAVAFAYANVINPKITIIPVALGIAGYILGPMLGVFLIGMTTKTRGSDIGNVIAVTFGLITIFVLSGRLFDVLDWLRLDQSQYFPSWLPRIEFTWYALIGALATWIIGLFFRTPQDVVAAAESRKAIDEWDCVMRINNAHLIIAIVIVVLLTAIAVFLFAPGSRPQSITIVTDTKLSQALGGAEVLEVISKPDQVSAIRLNDISEPDVAKLGSPDKLPATGNPVVVPLDVMKRLASTLSSESTYKFDMKKDCKPRYGVRFKFQRGKDVVDVLLCYDCDILLTFLNGKSVGGENFDYGQRELRAIARELFPNDPAIQSLK